MEAWALDRYRVSSFSRYNFTEPYTQAIPLNDFRLPFNIIEFIYPFFTGLWAT